MWLKYNRIDNVLSKLRSLKRGLSTHFWMGTNSKWSILDVSSHGNRTNLIFPARPSGSEYEENLLGKSSTASRHLQWRFSLCHKLDGIWGALSYSCSHLFHGMLVIILHTFYFQAPDQSQSHIKRFKFTILPFKVFCSTEVIKELCSRTQTPTLCTRHCLMCIFLSPKSKYNPLINVSLGADRGKM